MTTKSLHAWFIHKQWSGDTSARISFFTSELGVVQGLYKGGRTPKKQALLQPFTSLWISLEERRGHFYVQTVEQDAPMLPLAGTSLFSALYLNELIHYILKPLHSEPELFQAYSFVVQHLSLTQEKMSIEALLRRFEWSLLQTAGHHFSLTHEAETGHLVCREKHYQFIAGKGMVLTDNGIPGEHVLALAADDLTKPDYLKSAKIIMRQAIDYLLGGREIKARALCSGSSFPITD
jgi:DNA repair protein RecO (recombination protein O)